LVGWSTNVSSYRGTADRPERAVAIGAVVAIHVLLAIVILSGLDVRNVRQVVDRISKLNLAWIHPMHGGSFERKSLGNYATALKENEFAFRGLLLGREIASVAPM